MLKRTIVALAFTAAFSSQIAPANAADVIIRYSNWLPAKFFLLEDVIKPWIAEVEKITDGRVKIETTPKVVGSVASQYDVVRDGLADLSYITTGYTPGRFPLLEFGELPLIGSGKGADLAPSAHKIFEKYVLPKIDLTGIKVLAFTTVSPSQVFTKKRSIASIDDIRGVKLRASSQTMAETEKLMGAVPVVKSADEAYEMLSSGALDGQITLPNTITGFNQLDLLDGSFRIPGGVGNSSVLWAINAATWDKISPKDQKAILAISGEEFSRRVGTAYDMADAKAYEAMGAKGYHITTASEADLNKLKGLLAPLRQKWIEKAKRAGLDSAETLLKEYETLSSITSN